MTRLAQLIDTSGEKGLTGARWASKQDRIGRSDRHALNSIDKLVERRIARLYPGFQERDRLLLFALKAASERGIAV